MPTQVRILLPPLQILAWPEADVPPSLRSQVVALHDEVWPPRRRGESGPTHDPALRPLSMLLVDGERVLAALDILSTDITHRGERYAVSGLSAVVTARGERSKGHGRALVEAVRARMAESGADLGLFTCDPALEAFYASAGWEHLPGTVLIGGTPDAPFPSDHFDKVTLGSFFSDRARGAAGDFEGARIELYPGAIDRLW